MSLFLYRFLYFVYIIGVTRVTKMNLLHEVNGESTSLSDSPCIGRCSTTWGDIVCQGCGRTEIEIRDWPSYSDFEKKLINLKNSVNYDIRQKKEFRNMSRENKEKEIENKLFAARCLIEMIGDDLIHTFGKDPIIEKSYKDLYNSLESIKKAKENLPVALKEAV